MNYEISLCTTCANRFDQFHETFETNYQILLKSPDVEWIIVNFGSTDQLHDYMIEKLPFLSRRVTYIRELSSRGWHMSIAKNVAHRSASGNVLMNLDCDNFIHNSLEAIRSSSLKILHHWSGEIGDGTRGRISVDRDIFYSLGGYDESFYPMGYQDTDFLNRALASGIEIGKNKMDSNLPIPNTKQDSIKLCKTAGMDWRTYNKLNSQKSKENINAGKLVANDGRWLTPLDIDIYHGFKKS